jgi:hypothetical protein
MEIKDKIIVLDDIVPTHYSDLIEELVFSSLPFALGATINSTSVINNPTLKNNKNIYEQFQLGSPIVQDQKKNQNLEYFYPYFTLPLILAFSKLQYKINVHNIIRLKVNMQTKAYENVENKHNIPHIDNHPKDSKQIITSIYYINDSDGDTVFFNEKLKEGETEDTIDLSNLTIKQKVSPKKGRLCLFPSDIFHAGIHPQNNNFRSVINYNYYLGS